MIEPVVTNKFRGGKRSHIKPYFPEESGVRSSSPYFCPQFQCVLNGRKSILM